MPRSYQNRPTASKSVSGTICEKDLVSEHLIRLTSTYPYFLQEFTLLDDAEWDDKDQGNDHELFTAPILTRDAYVAVGGEESIGQYGVMGKILGVGSVLSDAHCECLHAETFIQVKRWRPDSRGPQTIPEYGECQLIR
jgi:hypothetical protein